MSKIHVLSAYNYFYKIAIHFSTPTGNNTVGLSWKACALSSGDIGSTQLSIGTAPGEITQTEYDSIVGGDTIELIKFIKVGSSPTNTMVENIADILINEFNSNIVVKLKYFGHKIEA